MKMVQQASNPRQGLDALLSSCGAIMLLLAIAPCRDFTSGITVSIKLANNFRVPLAKSGGEAGTTERAIQFLSNRRPGREMQLRRVHERSVHVPNDSEWA